MYTVSSNFLTKLKSASRTFDMKVEIGSPVLYTLTPDDIIDFTIEDVLGNDNIPGIGGVLSSVLTFNVLITDNVPVTFGNAPIKPFVAIDGEWVPLGVFYPDIPSIKKTEFAITGTCYDKMTFYENMAYSTVLTYPTNIRNVATEMISRFGVQFEDVNQLPSVDMKAAPTGTVRQVLAELAEQGGMNATLNRLGQVDFRRLTNTTFTLNDENYIEFALVSDTPVVIDKLVCVKPTDENETDLNLRYGSGTGATLSFENENITTVAELQTMYNLSFPLTYYPYKLKSQGFPIIDCGDKISIITNKGATYTIPILRHKLSYAGGLISEFEAAAPAVEEVSTGSTGANSITQSINTMQVNMIKADAIYTQSLDALSARIGTVEANYITTGELSAEYAEIDFANVGDAVIDTAMIQDAAITNAKIGNLAVDAAKIADATITSAKIADATIQNADIANATITGAKIANATIDTAQIKDAAIQTAKIGDAQITTAKIGALAVDTANIKDSAITNAKIANAIITGAKIANATIGTANIANGAITNALIGTAAVGTTQIADASITDAKITELTANKINAGTLSVERLIFTGPTGILYTINNLGELTSSSTDTLDGYIVTPRTITADRIVADAITANEIASNTITANEILANTITGDKIAANTINGDRLIADTVTAGRILVNSEARNADVVVPSYLELGMAIADTAVYPTDKIYISGLILSSAEYDADIKLSTNTLNQFYLSAGTIKTNYDAAYTALQAIQTTYPGLTDMNIATTYSATDIDAINNTVSNYTNAYNALNSYLSNYFKNANQNVIIDTNGIHIGEFANNPTYNADGSYVDTAGGPNSRLTPSALEFKYGAEKRVSIEAENTVVNNAKLRGTSIIEDSVTLPSDITIGTTITIKEVTGGINFNFK